MSNEPEDRSRAKVRAAERALDVVAAAARGCTVCAPHLPLGPRPTFRVHGGARLLIVGQAPGTRVHASGIPWNDPSGERLRAWLALDGARFYDETRVAILPIGLCYPGTAPGGGDHPPRAECAGLWQARFRDLLPRIELTLLIGTYAQAFHLGPRRRATLTETVRAWRDYLPEFLPLPHPSWRTLGWQKRNLWFESETLPELRRRVHAAVA